MSFTGGMVMNRTYSLLADTLCISEFHLYLSDVTILYCAVSGHLLSHVIFRVRMSRTRYTVELSLFTCYAYLKVFLREVNSQPRLMQGIRLRDSKTGIWCNRSAH